MVKAWWIRRWYFLYISVFTMLPSFRKSAMRISVFCRPFGPDSNFKQLTNALYPIIPDETSFLTHRFRLSNTYAILILAFVYSKSIVHLYTPIILLYSFIRTPFAIKSIRMFEPFQVFLLNKFRDEIF
ncbi:hypothetical protein HanPI659440_Chr11g0414141 [Helianthus annuus]|nr:hypothetical protein HanPI659440_Chr11g0414141 [Helianthus annuus]